MNTLRTWVDVSLQSILHNYREIRRLVGETRQIMAVVKADAYGHGAKRVAETLERAGIDCFGVATLQEGIDLREHGIHRPILVLGGTSPDQTALLLKHRITQTVFDLNVAQAFSNQAVRLGGTLKIHLKIDTGMSRLGFTSGKPGELEKAAAVCALKNLEPEGIFTHLTSSEVPEDKFCLQQIDRFTAFVEALEQRGLKIPIKHTANSGGVINYPESYFNLVRTGLALYGLYPGPGLREKISLQPAMQLRATVAQIHSYDESVAVSYNRRFQSSGPIRTATITIGYADGLSRVLSGKMQMLLRGKRVPQVGMICMDMAVIDISGVPDAQVGDVVTLFGGDNGAFIPVEELSDLAGTVSYEVICALSGRVGRIYSDVLPSDLPDGK